MSLYLGIDVGGSALKTAAVAAGPDTPRTARRSLDGRDPVEAVVEVVAEMDPDARPVGVGLGLAGLVRWPEGTFVWGPHLAESARSIRTRLADVLGVPVVVDNDANAAAHGELVSGAAQGARNAVVVVLGTGIGGGIVVDGAVHRGRFFAGEIGHMAIDPAGPACACGQRGCWETLVSGQVLDDAAGRLGADPQSRVEISGERPSAADLVVAAEAGDDPARKVLAEAGHWLGVGIVNLIAALDPDRVVVAGTVSAAGEWLLSPARAAIASRLPGGARRPPTEVVASRWEGFAGAVGAALLARDEMAS